MKNNKIKIVSKITTAFQDMERNNCPFIKIISSNLAVPNDGVIFFKPEICSVPLDKLNDVLTYFIQMTEFHSIRIRNVYVLSGTHLLKHHLLDDNYKSIKYNSLLSIKKDKECSKYISSLLKTYKCKEIKGGLFLAQQGFSPEYLMELWTKSGPVMKIATDFYGVPCTINKTRTLLVNAFYPSQIEQYKTHDSKIILFTFNTKTSFIKLKKYFQGSAEPEGRFKTSLREYLAEYMKNQLLEELTSSRNGIHLSANRVEGRKEAKIFLDTLNLEVCGGGSI